MLRAAVIGMGPIGNRHAKIYGELPDVELVAICDINRDRVRVASKLHGVKGFYSVEEMVDAIDIDLVSIATAGEEYGGDHYEPTIAALEAGLHVLGEKPISNEIASAEEMVSLAYQKGLCYGINMNHRFTPAAILAKKWMDEGKVGDLLFMNMSMWIKNPRESSLWFQIKALHPHTVDIMRYYCGEIECVQCFGLKAPGRSIYSTAQFNMRFKNGCLGHLTGSYDIERGHPMERCEVAGVKGRFVVEDMFREATLYPAGEEEKRVFSNPIFGGMSDFEDTFRNRLKCFVEEVSNGVDPQAINGSGRDGLRAQRVLAAAIHSIETESVVYVDG